MESHGPERGALVYDRVARVVGEFRGRAGPYAMLRPVGGGREWQADPADLRPATPAERLSAGVRAANDRTRAGAETAAPVPDLSRPPRPVPHCVACALLVRERRGAQERHDRSAETDANVLMRRHLARDHP
ncbi:hypothetical protein [Streptomyces sp. WAC08241]|uniref:hypothetical protein n=1 Tax=Streptomyces sp. WAC08241 TaxID=2487421 RepID=UPI000F76FEB7|nr:hypothetical protein [Streptomyces sp. WAC08241]RSS35257.1 hypothetical protein EF906_27870 [Streptomyces sp. WAC08241]